jgi:hypothetical protein
MDSLAIDGFYTLCLRDALRPANDSAPSLARAAHDLVVFAQSRGTDQATVLAELDRASRSVEWVTSFEVHVHTQALSLGRAAIVQAWRTAPGLFEVPLSGASSERPQSRGQP